MKTIDYNELDIISYNHNSGSFAEIDKCIFNGEIYALKRFTNGKYQEFDLPKRRIASNGVIVNKYEHTFYDEDNNLCILISDKNIKYMKELFE